MNPNDATAESPKHSIGRSILLHLAPGALIFIVYIAGAAILRTSLPPVALLAALSLAIVLALVPFELGGLLFLGWRRNRRLSLSGVVLYREPVRVRDGLVVIPLLLVWAVVCYAVISPPVEAFLRGTLFAWWPDWLIPSAVDSSAFAADPILGLIALASLPIQAVIGPVVEELYFRGYLLPRLAHLKAWAPLINTVLFSLYHFFTPWQNPARILALLPVIYLVQRRRSMYLGIVFHIVLNLVGQGIVAAASQALQAG